MENYFSDFQKGRPFADIIRELKSVYSQRLNNAATGIDANAIQDFSFIKDRVCYKLVNKELNAGLLSTVPHRDFHGLASINTPELNRGQISPLSDELDSLVGNHSPHNTGCGCCRYNRFDFTSVDESSLPLYIATNARKVYGSAVILYKGLLDTVAKMTGSFFVLPSSVHECIFAPGVPEDAERMAEMVKSINATQVAAEEVLYDGCFYYNAESHELHRAA